MTSLKCVSKKPVSSGVSTTSNWVVVTEDSTDTKESKDSKESKKMKESASVLLSPLTEGDVKLAMTSGKGVFRTNLVSVGYVTTNTSSSLSSALGTSLYNDDQWGSFAKVFDEVRLISGKIIWDFGEYWQRMIAGDSTQFTVPSIVLAAAKLTSNGGSCPTYAQVCDRSDAKILELNKTVHTKHVKSDAIVDYTATPTKVYHSWLSTYQIDSNHYGPWFFTQSSGAFPVVAVMRYVIVAEVEFRIRKGG